ncbi:MAG: hypothetical protein J1E34_08440 [Oscillospiraceae bacterium]|nr:hypothetical protein [Oscillospiraceae bacterium]
MPYIKLTTTACVSDEKCNSLKAKFGKAIESFKGKNESWLMVAVDDGKRMWFRGDDSADTAMVDVELLGSVAPQDSEKMTASVCDILESELGISPDRIYVKYTGYSNWGWNGSNF